MDGTIYKNTNREIFGFIKHLDADPDKTRPVQFFFYCEEEGDVYRLADELQQLNFRIVEVTQSMDSQWFCLGEMNLVPEPQVMDRCTQLLVDLAERYDALYDGWETRIDL